MAKITDGLALAYSSEDGLTRVLSRTTLKPVAVSTRVQETFTRVKHRWSVVVSMLARTTQGELQVVSRQVILPVKVRKAQLAHSLAKIHGQVSDDISYNNPDWVIENATWLADPLGGDWSEEDISRALKSINC